MAYRALALTQLVAEVNAQFPRRDKASDGWKGDAAHAARKSDHNPEPPDDCVRAQDIDEDLHGPGDPNGQADMALIAERIRYLGENGDPRLVDGRVNGYVIYEGHIAGAGKGWKWRTYTGPNAHDHHMHVSVCQTRAQCNSTASWGIAGLFATQPPPPPLPPQEDEEMLIVFADKSHADSSQVLALDGRLYVIDAGPTAAAIAAAGYKTLEVDPVDYAQLKQKAEA